MKKASARFAVGSFLAFLACLPNPVFASPRAQTAPPAKKVWDNDDLVALRATSAISEGGTPRPAKPQNYSDKTSADEQAKKAKKYREQLQPLYAQLPKIDAEIAKMKSFEDGTYKASPSSGLPAYNAGRPLNPADRINQLQKQRSEVVARIGDIEDQARHAGVLPGDLR